MKSNLNELASIKVGYQSRSKIKESINGTHYLLQGKDFDDDNNIIHHTITRIKPDRKPELYAVSKNDLLFQARGTNHFTHCIDEDLTNVLASNSFYIIRPDTRIILPQYLTWYLNLKTTLDHLELESGGSIISFISINTLSKLSIDVPSIAVQKKIIKVQELAIKEKELYHQISDLRLHLADKVCKNAATFKENE
jgi:restriction endonuclease S subunit